MRGYKIEESASYTERYVKSYGGDDYMKWLLKLMARIESIVDFITNFGKAKSPSRKAEEKTGEPKTKAEELADEKPKPTENKESIKYEDLIKKDYSNADKVIE
jgi:hypothetical protein